MKDIFNKKLIIATSVYGVILLITFMLFKTIFMLSYIPSESMEGTLQKGNILIASRYDIAPEELQRYDILIFELPDAPSETYIKRLIGLPGETIEVSHGKVYADGVELDDSFLKESMNELGDGMYEVPEGCYFFLGDNRNNSKDSRFWEKKYVPIGNIQAKARYVLFPFTDTGSLQM